LSRTLRQLPAAAAQTFGRPQKLQAILEQSHRALQHLDALGRATKYLLSVQTP
jgi:hypothetical protein